VAPEGIHLTLKFLGNISVSSIPDVTRVMEESAFGIPPFRLEVKGLGVFPDARRVRVVWVGMEGELDILISLQKRLDSELVTLGFSPETRPFTAHLTLARMRDEASPSERQAIGQLAAATDFNGGSFVVESVSLMKSQLTRDGAVYSRMASVQLTSN
jgi:2'-5' RNA ligase